MDNEKNEQQLELFDELNKNKEHKILTAIREKLYKPKAPVLSVSLESIFFVLTLFVIITALAFSLGVERGKQISVTKISIAEQIPDNIGSEKKVPASSVSTTQNKKYEKSAASKLVTHPGKSYQKYFTIQIAAVKTLQKAEAEIKLLKMQGYSPFMIFSNGLYQVCVNKSDNKKTLETELLKLSKKYEGSFIKLVSEKEAKNVATP